MLKTTLLFFGIIINFISSNGKSLNNVPVSDQDVTVFNRRNAQAELENLISNFYQPHRIKRQSFTVNAGASSSGGGRLIALDDLKHAIALSRGGGGGAGNGGKAAGGGSELLGGLLGGDLLGGLLGGGNLLGGLLGGGNLLGGLLGGNLLGGVLGGGNLLEGALSGNLLGGLLGGGNKAGGGLLAGLLPGLNLDGLLTPILKLLDLGSLTANLLGFSLDPKPQAHENIKFGSPSINLGDGSGGINLDVASILGSLSNLAPLQISGGIPNFANSPQVPGIGPIGNPSFNLDGTTKEVNLDSFINLIKSGKILLSYPPGVFGLGGQGSGLQTGASAQVNHN